ncbi:MAG: hypothetical protein V1646_03390 [bacterium]
MKRYLAILCSSILLFASLGLGFVNAVDQIEAECVLQESADKLAEDISSGAVCVDELSLSDISVDEVSLAEKDYSLNDLTIGDKLQLLWFAIITGELKNLAIKHVSKNKCKYICGAAASATALAAVLAYYLNQKNQKVDVPKN